MSNDKTQTKHHDADQARDDRATNATLRGLRISKVKSITGYGSSSIWAMVKAGTFPRPVKLGPRCTVWLEHEVMEWMRERIEESRKAAA
jgi:prophage regulatory protein